MPSLMTVAPARAASYRAPPFAAAKPAAAAKAGAAKAAAAEQAAAAKPAPSAPAPAGKPGAAGKPLHVQLDLPTLTQATLANRLKVATKKAPAAPKPAKPPAAAVARPNVPAAPPAPPAKPAAAAAAVDTPAPGAITPTGGFRAAGGAVTVDILRSDSGYDNRIYWSTDNFATRHLIGIDDHTGSVDLGQFAAGTRIEFGIDNGQGGFFRTGGAAANADGVDHVRTSGSATGQVIGFEDLSGGGDRDFNDAIIQVRGLASTPAPAAPPVAGSNDNRSGLGDGSNPGQGAGRAHASNQGTLNPSQATALSPPNQAAVARNSELLAATYGSFAAAT